MTQSTNRNAVATGCIGRESESGKIFLPSRLIVEFLYYMALWLGMYGFGEFARLGGKNEYHNYTSALYVIYR
ncbi:MAG: hypothetical protein ACKOA1_01710 [Bacteroidota bacterium]